MHPVDQGEYSMGTAKTEVDATSLEGVVAEWFFQQGMKISSIQIKAVGEEGDWAIGQATRRGGPDYHALARKAEEQLRPKYKLVVVEVRHIAPAPLEA
jgi:hypothetical protein